MDLLIKVLNMLNTQVQAPAVFGVYHIICLLIVAGLTVFLCTRYGDLSREKIRKVVFWTAMSVVILEVYKQTVYSFTVEDGKIVFDYAWYAFPWQFCSTPMYVGVLVGLTKKGKVHDALAAYLASYSIFAGLCVMVYPGDVFTETAGINFQTVVCHGSMIVIGVWLLVSGYVKPCMRSLKMAMTVFATTIGIAMILNEIAHATGLLETDTFNMFLISPYCEPSLPVYSEIQEILPYPLSVMAYIGAFTLASGIIMAIAGYRRKTVAHCTPATT